MKECGEKKTHECTIHEGPVSPHLGGYARRPSPRGAVKEPPPHAMLGSRNFRGAPATESVKGGHFFTSILPVGASHFLFEEVHVLGFRPRSKGNREAEEQNKAQVAGS